MKKVIVLNPPYIAFFALTISTIFLFICLFFQPSIVGFDQAMYLHAGKLVINGYKPFIDFFDINPPLIVYTSAVVSWFSHVLNIQDIIMFKIFILVYIFYFSISTFVFLNKHSTTAKILISTSFILLFSFNAVIRVLGQRDQLFAMSLVLYLLSRWSHYDDDKPTGTTPFFQLFNYIIFAIITKFIS